MNPLDIYIDTVNSDTCGPSSLGSRNLRDPKLVKLGVVSKLLLLKHPQARNPVNPWPSQTSFRCAGAILQMDAQMLVHYVIDKVLMG